MTYAGRVCVCLKVYLWRRDDNAENSYGIHTPKIKKLPTMPMTLATTKRFDDSKAFTRTLYIPFLKPIAVVCRIKHDKLMLYILRTFCSLLGYSICIVILLLVRFGAVQSHKEANEIFLFFFLLKTT